MTITHYEIESKKPDFISASCSRCFRNGQMVFRIHVENPTEDQIRRVWYKAVRHDGRKHDHPITLTINHRVK